MELIQMEVVRGMLDKLLRAKNHEHLVNLFGGDCQEIVRIQQVFQEASSYERISADQRISTGGNAVESVVQVLKDIGLGSRLVEARTRKASEKARCRRVLMAAVTTATQSTTDLGLEEALSTFVSPKEKAKETAVASDPDSHLETQQEKRVSPLVVIGVIRAKNRFLKQLRAKTANIQKDADNIQEDADNLDQSFQKVLEAAVEENTAMRLDNDNDIREAKKKYREAEANLLDAAGDMMNGPCKDSLLAHVEKIRDRVKALDALKPGEKPKEPIEATISRTVVWN